MNRALEYEKKAEKSLKIRLTDKMYNEFMTSCRNNHHVASDIVRTAIDSYLKINLNMEGEKNNEH